MVHTHTVHLPLGALLIWCTNPCVAQVGTRCDRVGVTLARLPVRRGYWRPSNSSIDVRS